MITTNEYAGAELFNNNGLRKNLYITYDDGIITNEDIHFENFELTESLCSDAQLNFGSCEASCVKFRCSNVSANLKGKEITIDIHLDDNQITDPEKSGIYTARLSSSTSTRSYYILQHLDDFISQGSGIYQINTRFNRLPDYPSSDIYIVINNVNVPIVNTYFLEDESRYVKGYMLEKNTTYVLTFIYNAGVVSSYYFDVDEKITDEPFRLGTYYVESIKKVNEKRWLEVTAYDAMYYILNADVTSWYDGLSFVYGMTINEFRLRFFTYLGISQESTSLVNDSITMTEKSIDTNNGTSKILGADIITAICEINGCFGHVGRDGKFHYITLATGITSVYPDDDLYPSDDLYPKDKYSDINYAKSGYITANYEDYLTAPITGAVIVDTDDGIEVSIPGEEGNQYVIKDNILVKGCDISLYETIIQNIGTVIQNITYRPFEVKNLGNPCYEVGDVIVMQTKYDLIESYILQRRLTGIQAMKDNIIADGVEYYEK